MRLWWLSCTLMVSFMSLSMAIASVPQEHVAKDLTSLNIKDDTAIYQNLSETQVKKQGELNFDQDVAKLAQLEARYVEELPAVEQPRLRKVVQRVSKKQYRSTSRTKRKPIIIH
jgi:hypothetical protein